MVTGGGVGGDHCCSAGVLLGCEGDTDCNSILHKFNVPFYRDFLCFWPVDAVSVSAVSIITDPSRGHSTPLQLCAGVGVYPHLLPPLQHACKVGLLASEAFKGRGIT